MLGRPRASASPTAPAADAPTADAFGRLNPRSERNRSLWQFMAWSFIVAETAAASAWMAGLFRRGGDDDASAADAAHQNGAGAGTDFAQADATANGEDEADAAAAVNQAASTNVDTGPMQIDFLAGPGAKHVGSGTSFVHARLEPVGGGLLEAVKMQDGIEMPGIPILPNPLLLPFDQTTIDYFNGLKAFTEGLGFADDPFGLAQAAPGTSVGAVGVALEFTQNAFTPIGFWQSVNHFDPHVQPLMRDSVGVDWLVQLNGMKNGQVFEADQVMGFEQADHAIARNYEGNAFGNNASVVDGQDWSGTLWVKGNYYEFNTIVQVNILWDNDKITFADFQSAGATPGDLAIRSGDNQQLNTANIGVSSADAVADSASAHAGDSTAAHQLIMGGRTEASAAYQFNSIVDMDEINFNVDQLLGDTLGSIDFASVYAAGHIQGNYSTIISDNDNYVAQLTPAGLLLKSKGHLQQVNGDYYEFNTLVQLNVISDADEIAETRSDTDGGQRGGVIASGGTMQFNNASIAKNDHYDDLYVGGRYSQYNLVLQINAMQDDDRITENRGAPGSGDPHATDTGTDGGFGTGGDHTANVTIPTVQDDPMARHNDML